MMQAVRLAALIAATVAATSTIPARSQVRPTAPPHNIAIIQADDLGYDACSSCDHGCPKTQP